MHWRRTTAQSRSWVTNLRTIARELVETVRKNVSIDWTVKESVRARGTRLMVKRVLKKNGYPPDKQERAVQTILLSGVAHLRGLDLKGAPAFPFTSLTTPPAEILEFHLLEFFGDTYGNPSC